MHNTTTVLFLIRDDLRAIRVSYDDGKSRESIKKTFLRDIAVGDFVTVETDTRWSATVCKVVAVDVEVDLDSTEKVGWIFGKVDMAELDRLKAVEAKSLEIIREAELRKRKRELRDTLMAECRAELMQIAGPAPADTPPGA